ncbi:hypothetical protein B0H17DRAFT_1082061 [Mycena rosella]|uniref:DUF7704 domain-containing protein n=1 Tax=Mycena rosella TaxID=1033263 RepID=A0AAD7G7I9_MYCRO|nr:hypothetical protein B0H17DRAFT_1082061 [Mycena rosella]
MGISLACLPADVRCRPPAWNAMAHGNISFVGVLFAARCAWFLGVGRTLYYFRAHTKIA